MGGSGGSFYRGTTAPEPDQVAKQIEKSVQKTQNQEFEIEINELLGGLLAQINDRDHQEIKDLLTKIKEELESEIEGSIDLRYGGSVSKHTYVDGLSDIDSLVFLNKSELIGKLPNEVKSYFFDKLQTKFPNEEVTQGELAVTVKFRTGTEIQLLPAIRYNTGIKIPSSSTEWSNIINVDRFAKLLRGANIKMKGKLLPVIKIAKSILSKLPENLRLSGYHTEAISIQAFYNYEGERKLRPMLRHFFESASKISLKAIEDKTKQSIHVDDYLGGNNSLSRKIISNRMDQISRQMKNADLTHSTEYWKRTLN